MLRKVYLQGELGQKYGEEFEINAIRPIEVFQCLEGNFDDFRKYMLDCEEKGIGFTVQVGKENIDREEDLLMTLNQGDIMVTPVPAGSKSGGAKILTAILIVGAMIFAPQMLLSVGPGAGAEGAVLGNWAIAGGALTTPGQIAALVAINLALTGLQQLMAPDPATDSQQDESYLFNGPAQNIIEGDPVPVLYGRLRVPGRPISFEVLNRKFTGATETGAGSSDGLTVTGPDGTPIRIDISGI